VANNVAKELNIDPSLLSKWRGNPRYNGGKVLPDNPKVRPEEQGLGGDTELARDILNYSRWGVIGVS